MKGILTHHFVFASFEDGTERLFEIHGKDIVECNDRLKEFIDEVGEENYAACKFPEELLKDSFFDAHRRCFQEYRLNVHPD